MPVITVHSPDRSPGTAALETAAELVSEALGIPPARCLIVWHREEQGSGPRPAWNGGSPAPMAFMACEGEHSAQSVREAGQSLATALAEAVDCAAEDVVVSARRVSASEQFVRDEDGEGAGNPAHNSPDGGSGIEVAPIGVVESPRTDLSDDGWGGVHSRIRIGGGLVEPSALDGLDEFSHIEVVYFFHRVDEGRIIRSARHPRGNEDWPRVGVLSQRMKNRVNRIGVSRCRLLGVGSGELLVRGLDAIDGSPVLDIKPYMEEFGPQGPVYQPNWAHEVMRDYY